MTHDPVMRPRSETPVQVRVLREACCAQDDQLGPLEAAYSVTRTSTIGELVRTIAESRFLQYSASHTSLVGFVGAEPFVRVFSSHHAAGRAPEFSVPSSSLVSALVGTQTIEFRFV